MKYSMDIWTSMSFNQKINVNMRKIASLLAVLMLFSALAFAQTTRTVTGQVKNDKGEVLPFATILETGTRNATKADGEGFFSIKIKEGSQITVSAVGGEPVTLTPGAGAINVTLKSTGQLQEVVVSTTLGIQRQKKELGYATTKVGGAELTQAKPVGVATGLQGKVSGLNVTTVNNGVFADVKINLRGIRSITGDNNPMLLIDGVPTPIGYLSSINPNDIQEVNIIKGTSGTAIYGPDGRNGAIVITTKKGTRDGKPVVTVSQTTQMERVNFLPDFQTRFGSGSSVDAFGNGQYTAYENQQYGPEFDGSIVPIGPELEDGDQQTTTYSAKPKEKRKFWDNGITMQNDVSISGQNFYLGVQYVDIKGILPKDKNNRASIRFNAAKEYGKFRASFNVNYIQQNYDVANQGANEWGPIQWLVFNTPMHIPLTSYQDHVNNKYAQFSNYFNEYYPNPYWVIDQYRAKGKNDDLLANTELNFKATNWLTFTHRAAISASFGSYKNTSAAHVITPWADANRDGTLYKNRNAGVADGLSRSSRITSEFFAAMNKTVGDFRVTGILGHMFRQSDAKSVDVSGSNLSVPTVFNVAQRTGEPGASEGTSRTRLVSAFGSASVSYKGWANVEVTGRNDWTSLLAIGNNSFFYPGVSASLVLSDAVASFKSSKTISYLKLRASWNKSGTVNVGAYQLASTFSQAGGFPYGAQSGFTANNTALNPALKPEFIENFEVGAEISFLRNRINFEVAYYNQDNKDQIISVQTSSATGYTSTLVNAASFDNKGLELDLKLTPLIKFNKGNIEFRANYTYNDSKIRGLFQDVGQLFVGGFTGGSQAANWAIVGQPAFVFRGLDYQRDPSGRVIVDANTGYPSLETVADTFGRTMPLHIFGMTPTINWNGFSLSVVADYRGGHYSYHGIGPDMDFTGVSARTARNGRQRFVFPNSSYWDGSKYVPNTSITVANGGYDFYTSAAYNRNASSNYLTSAASWRIREISLGYDIPVKWFGNQNVIKKASFSLNARNVAIWLPKTNEWTDPDFNFSTGNSSGINSSSQIPPTRIFGANLTLVF
jgi:TonB-linked SusC/RagA family outer membrane protein